MEIGVSYDSKELMEDVLDDIALFGENFNVYAIYEYREEYDFEYISDYVDADEPIRKELWSIDEQEFQKVLEDFKKNIASLKFTKHRRMTLVELLRKLEEQHGLSTL